MYSFEPSDDQKTMVDAVRRFAARELRPGMRPADESRELAAAPRLLVASQPTRGVDIGAAQALHQRLVALRDQGAAVLLVSADLDELLALSDRVAVMFQGRIAAHFAGGSVSASQLGLYMTGLRGQAGAAATLAAPFTPLHDEAPA